MASFKVNGRQYSLDLEAEMPLLWALRNELGLNGTKFGCGIAACGACTVQVNGSPVRSCVTPLSAVDGAEITTIEGLAAVAGADQSADVEGDPVNVDAGNPDAIALTAVQQAWIEHQVPQCGYCQPGMIMAVSSLLSEVQDPGDEEIDSAISNICRCGTYPRVRRAIKSLINSPTQA